METKPDEDAGGDWLRWHAAGRGRPLWVRVVVGGSLVVILVLGLGLLYVVWFVTGKPNVTVDYIPLVNRMSESPPPQADNAWSHYEEAFDAYIDPNDATRSLMETAKDALRMRPASMSLDQEQERTVRRWLQENEQAWQQFVAGSRIRYYQRSYDLLPADHSGQPWLWQIRATRLENLRRFGDLGVWRSRLAVKEGNLRAALEDCLALMRAGVHWQRCASLVEQLTGSALGSMAHEQMLQLIADPSVAAADLSWLQEQITEVYAGGFPLIRLESDRLCLLDTVQHVFTEGGRGGGHVIPRELARLFEMMGGDVSYWGPPPKGKLQYLRLSMAHVRRDEFLAKANDLYDRADQLTQMTPYQCRQAGIWNLERTVGSLDKRKYALIWWIFPAAERVSALTFGHRAMHEGTLIVLALRRWQCEKGNYPAELNMLVEGQYLRDVPLDPFRGGPPVYRRTGDGFLLYSPGLDFNDDGGKPGLDRTGRARLFAGDGDLVFWPPVYIP
jgi:hypothetical protein